MTKVLNLTKISKNMAVKIYNQMLLDICKMNPTHSLEKANNEVIEGSMIAEGQYLIKIKTDYFGTVFEHISLKSQKVSDYQSYQKQGNKLYKFSDSTLDQFTKLKFYIK